MKARLIRTVIIKMNEEEAKNVLSLLTTDPDHDDEEEKLVRTDLKNVLHYVLTQEEEVSNPPPKYYKEVKDRLSNLLRESQPQPKTARMKEDQADPDYYKPELKSH